MKTNWRTLTEHSIKDISTWVREAAKDGQHVNIGTDSLQTKKYTQFVTVVVIHTPGKGGRVAYTREVVPRIKSLRDRLWKEVYRSTEVAMQLSPTVKGELSVHIDASPEEKNMSNRYLQELTGLVMGQGFKAVIKPDSYAASHTADHIVRNFGKLPKKVA